MDLADRNRLVARIARGQSFTVLDLGLSEGWHRALKEGLASASSAGLLEATERAQPSRPALYRLRPLHPESDISEAACALAVVALVEQAFAHAPSAPPEPLTLEELESIVEIVDIATSETSAEYATRATALRTRFSAFLSLYAAAPELLAAVREQATGSVQTTAGLAALQALADRATADPKNPLG